MLEGKAKFIIPSKGSTGVIYIPADVVKDSSFPFRPEQEVVVRINDQKLVIQRRSRT
jgi:antitoxin component of MazEF toxin-antitoxin module